MKEYKQSPYKFILECILLFFTVSFFAFFINYLLIDNIVRVSFLEIIASFGIGLSVSIVYGFITEKSKNSKKIIIQKDRLIISGPIKKIAYNFEDIKSFDIISTAVLKLLNTVKIKIETKECCRCFFLQSKDLADFIENMPAKITDNKKLNKIRTGDITKNLLLAVLRTFELYSIGILCVLPAALNLVSVNSVDLLWQIVALSFIILVLWQVVVFIVKYIKYADYGYTISDGNLIISCGKIVKRDFYLSIENITAVSFTHNFISRLFNLYKISLLTRGSGKGIIETNYFPFWLNKTQAVDIITRLSNKEVVEAKLNKPKKATIIPSLVIWLLPIGFVTALSVIGSLWFFLLYLPIILFLVTTFKNNGKKLQSDYYILQKGFASVTRIFIPLNKIERTDALMTLTCRMLDMTYIEIYLSGYKAVIFGGYYYKSDFDNFVKKINELS